MDGDELGSIRLVHDLWWWAPAWHWKASLAWMPLWSVGGRAYTRRGALRAAKRSLHRMERQQRTEVVTVASAPRA
jgi:hypothetical protein